MDTNRILNFSQSNTSPMETKSLVEMLQLEADH